MCKSSSSLPLCDSAVIKSSMMGNTLIIKLCKRGGRCSIVRPVLFAFVCLLTGAGVVSLRKVNMDHVDTYNSSTSSMLNNGFGKQQPWSMEQQQTYSNTTGNSTPPQDPLFGHTITLTFRLTASAPNLIRYLFCQCLPSAAMFWSPKLGDIGLILDAESAKDHEFEDKLRRLGSNITGSLKINFHYEPLPRNRSILSVRWKNPSYNRQLWSSFSMDLYIDTSIVAWIDTDSLFTTPVTPENIFNSDGSKLKVKSMNMWALHSWVKTWDNTTHRAIGRRMPGDFMTYFPVYIWKDTITNCRKHILKHLKTNNFEDAFLKVYQPGFISPVNVIMSYAYYFEYDRYDWHFDLGKETLQAYNKNHVEPDSPLTANDTSPDVHVTQHTKGDGKRIERAYCLAKRYVDDLLPSQCKPFENITANFELFIFIEGVQQTHTETWCKGNGRNVCVDMIESHYRNVVKYYKMGWYDFDTQMMHSIRQAATAVDVECPTIHV